MSCLIRLCTSSFQPTCPNSRSPRKGFSLTLSNQMWMNVLAFLVLSIKIFQPVVSCFESPQQLGWELETFYNIWELFLNRFPAYTCIELRLRLDCCGKPSCTTYSGPGMGGHHHWPGWPTPPNRVSRDLQGWLTVWTARYCPVLTWLWTFTSKTQKVKHFIEMMWPHRKNK